MDDQGGQAASQGADHPAGTPEPVVAADRVIGTLAGGLTALIVHSLWAGTERLRIRKRKPTSTVRLDAA